MSKTKPKPAAKAAPKASDDEVRFPDARDLRDFFAGQALAGLLTHAQTELPGGPVTTGTAALIAADAYKLADAMLAIRERGWREDEALNGRR